MASLLVWAILVHDPLWSDPSAVRDPGRRAELVDTANKPPEIDDALLDEMEVEEEGGVLKPSNKPKFSNPETSAQLASKRLP